MPKTEGYYEGLGKIFSEIFDLKFNRGITITSKGPRNYIGLGHMVEETCEEYDKDVLETKLREIIEYMIEQSMESKRGWQLTFRCGKLYLTDGEFFLLYTGDKKPRKFFSINKREPEAYNEAEDWEAFRNNFSEELSL